MGWRGRAVVVLLVCSSALGAGCRGVSVVKVDRRSAAVAIGVPTAFLSRSPTDDPGREIADARLDRASASYRAGLGSEREAPEMASRYYLDALTDASEAMALLPPVREGPQPDPRPAEARAAYNGALRKALRVSSGRRIRLDRDWREGLARDGVRVSVLRDDEAWDPERFDEFLLADDYEVRSLDNQVRTDGVGVPLVALKKFDLKELQGRKGEEKFLMPRQVYPATAILRAGPTRAGEPPSFRLELHDPLLVRRVEFEGRREPLASDLTTPLAYHFTRTPLPILQEIGLLDPQWLEKLSGLYMLHPYEPGKIPVLLVHGLRSSPAAWMKVINELRGDPELADRYQFWLFLYPTGTPFPESAAKLRRALDELRAVVDPEHGDRALDRMVLVGHSMGGLISKMLILSSGDAIWKLISTRPFEQLKATPEHKEHLRQVFFFEPHPSASRVVFIATPHRGSDLGDQFIGRLADRLIRLPSSLRGIYRTVLAQNGPDFFNPEVRTGGLPSSIDELRRDNRLLLTLTQMKARPGVEVHSVIGQKDPGVPIEQGSDSVVPYASSHLDWARSELVVRGDHSCQDTPETIRELRRILYLHLGRIARETDAPRDPEVRRARPLWESLWHLFPRPPS